MNLDIHQLRLFTEVARAGSVNRAAKSLNLAQSALSRRMQQIETALGLVLFERRPDGVSLTGDGERLLLASAPLLAAYETFRREMSLGEEAGGPPFRFGVTSSIAQYLLTGLAARLHQHVPEVRLEVVEGASEHLRRWLLSGDLDLAVITNARPTRMIEALRQWREDLFLVAPLAATGGAAPTLKSLAGLPFILTSRTPGLRQRFEALFREAGLEFTVGMQMEAVSTVKRMVEGGSGYTILPYPAIATDLAEGRLSATRLPDVQFHRALARRPGQYQTPARRRLTAHLVEEFDARLAGADWAHPIAATAA